MNSETEKAGPLTDTVILKAAFLSLQIWMATMHGESPQQQRTLLVDALRDTQSTSLEPENVLEVVLPADMVWRPLARDMSRAYRRGISAGIPDAAQFHHQMGDIARLFGEIYAGSADLLMARMGDQALSRDQLRQVVARALFHLGKHARWQICNRERPDTGFWRILHGLFRLSIRAGFDKRPLTLYQDEAAVPTCTQLWLRTVMLATLNTGSLSPRQVDRAEQWLEEWGASIAIDQDYEPSRHLYCIDIAGEAGPSRIVPGLEMQSPVFLRTTQLYGDIVAARLHYLEQSTTSSLGLHARNPLREYLELLDQMQRIWASTPSQVRARHGKRTPAPQGAYAEVVQGIAQILALRSTESARTVRKLQWAIREYSDRGLGVTGPMEGADAPVTKQLIALHWHDSATWQLGVIVRTINDQAQQLRQAGVRLLAPEAILLTLAELPGLDAAGKSNANAVNPTHLAFYLTGNERSGQADSLLCANGTLVPKMGLSFTSNKNEFTIRINRVIEGTVDWQRVGFEVLRKRVLADKSAAGTLPRKLIAF